jgi:hypothetical protein
MPRPEKAGNAKPVWLIALIAACSWSRRPSSNHVLWQ